MAVKPPATRPSISSLLHRHVPLDLVSSVSRFIGCQPADLKLDRSTNEEVQLSFVDPKHPLSSYCRLSETSHPDGSNGRFLYKLASETLYQTCTHFKCQSNGNAAVIPTDADQTEQAMLFDMFARELIEGVCQRGIKHVAEVQQPNSM